MNYRESISFLFKNTNSYEEKGKNYYNYGIESMKYLCEKFNNPQKYFKSIHIAGTNGKGSTSHMLASILQESNYKIGLYTSPHFNDLSERIQCNGVFIDKEFIISFINDNNKLIKSNKYSLFEIITVLSFIYFKYKKVDFAIIETGLGGNLDSTNVIIPIISVITHIGMDHMDILGNDIKKIAFEKAGIIKYKIPVVIGENVSKTENVFLNEAFKKKANVFFAEKNKLYNNILISNYQIFNKNTTIKTIEVLKKILNIKILDINIKNGIKNIISNTNFMGRWQVLKEKPKIICDVAHNYDGMKMISNQIDYNLYNNIYFIFGFLKGRNILKMLSFFPKNANYYFCEPNNIHRKMSIYQIKRIIDKTYLNTKYFFSVKEALITAKNEAYQHDLILISGSFYIVSEIL